MSFLDPKEQVLSISLTSYGKKQLSKGKFKPAFYAFLDTDILYDSLYAGITASQSETAQRIKDTLQTMPQYSLEGVESSFKKFKHDMMAGVTVHFDMPEENLFAPIGDSSTNSNLLPAFATYFLNGQISGSVSYLSSSFNPNVNIPQLDANITYNIFLGSSEGTGEIDEVDRRDYDDGTSLSVGSDYILLEMIEENVEFESENFEISVFIEENEKLIPLPFANEKDPIGDILVVEKPGSKKRINLEVTDLEYFLDIKCDNQIPQEIICKAIKDKKNKNLFVRDNIKCRDKVSNKDKNLYKKPVDDFEEECEF